MNDDLFILDGYGLIYRAYFAFIKRPLTDRDGNNVSAVYGFFRSILPLIRDHGAKRIVVAMDPPGPTFRHEIYPEYKANRDSAPEELHAQVPLIKALLELLGIPVICIDGFEADDVMGSLAQYCREHAIGCRLVSSDKDLMQLVGDTVAMLRPEKTGGFQCIDSQAVLESKGVRPDQIVDYLALVGDTSDNIPGVAGIGDKSAVALLSEWGTINQLYANLDKAAKGAKLEKLRQGRESAYFSRQMVIIRTDLDVANMLEHTAFPGDSLSAAQLLRERGLRTLAKDIEGLSEQTGKGSHEASSSTTLSAIYTNILSVKDMEVWGRRIRKAGLVALDTETDRLDAMQARMVGLSVAVDDSEAAYLPIHCVDSPCLELATVVHWLNDIFADGKVRIIGQNFKYDMKILQREGVHIGGAWFDTMLAAWLLDASSPVGMDALADRYLRVSTTSFSDIVPKGGTFMDVPLERATVYAAEDAAVTMALYRTLQPLLKADSQLWAVFQNLEMPLQPILAEMEMEGIGLNTTELQAYGRELADSIDVLVKDIHAMCGHEFNIASPKQLQKVLFEERGLTPGKKTKTGYSTDNTVLADLAREDPVPEKILLYRSLSKLKSTYVDVLPQLAHPQDGRIHTSYMQNGAATGRLSSNNPNLQNIPVRDENGRRIRRAFRCRPHHIFVSADYSQIELVILAHLSGDEALSGAFRDGVDVHARTAALLFGVSIQDVTSEQRRMAKAVNFGVMYGMSAFRLSNELGIARKEAQHFIEAYFTTYHGIRRFVDSTVDEAEHYGGVRTMDGRFRPLPGIHSRNRVEKAAADRAAVNSRIQGTAADIMKKAMIVVHGTLLDACPDAKMLLQVHDEILIEVVQTKVASVSQIVKESMESVASLCIPLRVNVEIGSSWGDIH